MRFSVTHAQWHAHVNSVNPSPALRRWLTDPSSMTRKLMARCTDFRVRRLYQGRAMCLADEWAIAGMSRRTHVQARDVLLQCDGKAMIFGHSIVPLTATAADWPFFSALGERPLGMSLFSDPRVAVGRFQYARLHAAHPLVRRAAAALGDDLATPLLARRRLYRRREGVLLVTELFLPALAGLILASASDKQNHR